MDLESPIIDEEAHLLGRSSSNRSPERKQMRNNSLRSFVIGTIFVVSLCTISACVYFSKNGFYGFRNHFSSLFVVDGEFSPIHPENIITAQGEDGPLAQLAPYEVDCSPYGTGQVALNSFNFDADAMVFNYGCSAAPIPYVTMSAQQYATDWLPIANDNVGALSQVNVYCPPESVMSEWHMNFQTPNVMNIGYTCISPVPAAECTAMIDKYWRVGHEPGPISSLGYAMSPACNDNAILQGWNIALNDENNFYFEWTCCTVANGFSVAGEFENLATQDGTLSNLALQDVDCSDLRGSDSPINSFQFNSKTNSYQYSCDSTSIPPTGSQSFTTTSYEGGFGGINYLDRHSVQCPEGMVLKQFQLVSDQGTIHYEYKCLSFAASSITCRFGYTTYADPGPTNSLDGLAEHDIACNSDEALGAFKLQTNPSDMTTVRYEFSCCTVLPSTSIAPSMEPSQEPTVNPVPNPTTEPTANPTYVPTVEPTAYPVSNPSFVPTLVPTFHPTMEPTYVPTAVPTQEPSLEPSFRPSPKPTAEPTDLPTRIPTEEPTFSPTADPTVAPSFTPMLDADPAGFGVLCPGMGLGIGEYITSDSLSFKLLMDDDGNLKVIDGSDNDVLWSTGQNIGGVRFLFQADGNGIDFDANGKLIWSTKTAGRPNSIMVIQNDGNLAIYDVQTGKTLWQTGTSQANSPNLVPFPDLAAQCFTASPTLFPTLEPTFRPTIEPTFNPTYEPTIRPSLYPTEEPTFKPTAEPTLDPTRSWAQAHILITTPTAEPTMEPTDEPTYSPVTHPTFWPTEEPTKTPLTIPTTRPSLEPTVEPTVEPTKIPISYPTFEPTEMKYTSKPTTEPSFTPTPEPTQGIFILNLPSYICCKLCLTSTCVF